MFSIDLIRMIETVLIAFDCPVFKLNILARVALLLVVVTGEFDGNFVENVVATIIRTVFVTVLDKTIVTLAVIDAVVCLLNKLVQTQTQKLVKLTDDAHCRLIVTVCAPQISQSTLISVRQASFSSGQYCKSNAEGFEKQL